MADTDIKTMNKERTQLRRFFTRACHSFEQLIKEETASSREIISCFKILEDKADRLLAVDDKIWKVRNATEDEDENADRDFEEAEAYREKWITLKSQYEQILQANTLDDIQSINSGMSHSSRLLTKLPKLSLVKFSGEIKHWLPFWAQFKRIHKSKELGDEEKILYLKESMTPGTRAHDLVNGFPPTAENYSKAVELLESRFGRKDLLIELYVRDILTLVNEKPPLSTLYDRIEVNVRSLESMGLTTENYAALLFPLVESCLSDELICVWQRSRGSTQEVGSQEKLKSLMNFIKSEVENEDYRQLTRKISSVLDKPRSENPSKRVVPSAYGLVSTVKADSTCIFCHEDTHVSSDCPRTKDMPLDEKKGVLSKRGACFICLKVGHTAKRCRQYPTCSLCERRHYSLMCTSGMKHENEKEDSTPEARSVTSCCSASFCVYLQTVLVKVVHGNRVKVMRALLDSASQHSYIKTESAERLGLRPIKRTEMSHVVFGGHTSSPISHDVFPLVVQSLDDTFQLSLVVLSQPKICSDVPRLSVEHVKDFGLSNLDVGQDKDIEILIGADYLGPLITGECRNAGELTAFRTRLGWTIFGKSSPADTLSETRLTPIMLNLEKVSNLWQLDVLGIEDPVGKRSRQQLEEEARQHFLETVEVKPDGRYEVKLPWLQSHLTLGPNYDVAAKRLEATKRKLIRTGFIEAYDNVFKEWLNEDIIEEVPGGSEEISGHYLPHRPVFKDSLTTPVRPVFDASAQNGSNPSLNDCLEKGENLIQLIPTLLMRFRKRKIGVIANIRKAFLQISLAPEERDFLRFLWGMEEVKTFRHKRVVFGVSSSPFLLGAVIDHLLEKAWKEAQEKQDTVTSKIVTQLKGSFYVDNCVTGVENERDLQQFIQVAQNVFAKHKFDLRGWEYTDESLEESVQPSSVLGIKWDRKQDTLSLNSDKLSKQLPDKITKRTLLSAVHRLFDPIGFSVPVTLLPKLLLQYINDRPWDEEVHEEIRFKFLRWLKDTDELNKIKIPRSIHVEALSISLHAFSDASLDAYSAVVYLRSETSTGTYVQLLQAKTRIAPIKRPTIPRMELLGATISSRLVSSIWEEFSTQDLFMWTDSTTVLAWIRREIPWTVFVKNRVEEIRQLTPKELWRHVPGSLNPADLPSRGCSASQLAASKWWEGPSWLYRPKEEWPLEEPIASEEEIVSEKRKTVTTLLASGEVSMRNWFYLRFSRFERIVRLPGWIRKFIYNCQNERKNEGDLICLELIEAERVVIRLVQEQSFQENESKGLASLQLFQDEYGILRVKTRITERKDQEEFLSPAVLPADHPVVQRLVHDMHVLSNHTGGQTLLGILREKFWIINGRRAVRAIVRKCVICKRFCERKLKVTTPPLPQDRVRDAKVFEVCGVDLAGPLFIRGDSKVWICLFTCAVYRSVHLEVLSSLSTDGFLQGLRRFISRRGRPSTIYSDNGTNFKGTSNKLVKLDWKKN